VAEKVKIKIQPSGGATSALTVEDAMQQVLDFIDMLRAADLSDSSERIVWRLESAHTNSPLEVTAFATGPDPSVSVSYQARQTAERLANTIESLENGGNIPDWMDQTTANIAERFFKRNMNGISRTDIIINDLPAITVVHTTAKIAALSIEKSRIQAQLEKPDWTRTEYGSVEGEIISTTSFHTKPALVIKERLSGDKINCILSDELARVAGPEHSWDETWDQKRFLVSGELHYNADGKISKINAIRLREITSTKVDLDAIRDLDLIDADAFDAAKKGLWMDG